MADKLPSIPLTVPQVSAPRPGVSPGQIAQPYLELANMLDKSAGALEKTSNVLMEDVAQPAAEKAGLQAVTRDDQGNLQIDKVPIFGDAAVTFQRAVKVGALADAEGVARRDDIALRTQFRDDPEGYTRAAEQYKKDKVDQYTKVAGPEVGVALGRVIESQTTQTYKGLLNETEHLALARAQKAMDAGIASARDDAVALARGGAAPDDPAMQQAFGKIEALTQEKVKNPRLAYPAEQAAYDIDHLKGELSANRFLYQIDKTYKDQGSEAALKQAETLLTNPDLKLTETQRYGYFHKAQAEIHANDAIRRQDLGEARKAANDAGMAAARGVLIDPELQNGILDRLQKSGGYSDAARFAATMDRARQLDSFNRKPLDQQVAQLQTFQTAGSAKTAYQFFVDKGYRPVEAATIVGHLIQESSLNPTTIHNEANGVKGFGVAGWNQERLQGLINFAKERNTSPEDFNTQLEYIHKELQSSEGTALAALKAASNPEQATAAFMHFERPRGYTAQNPQGGDAYDKRLANTRQILANVSGAPLDQRGVFGAGVDVRLAAGMQKGVDKKAHETWDKVSKDMDNGITPNATEMSQVINGFRLSGNQDMLEKVATRVDRFDAAARSAQGSLPQQQAMLAEFERRGAEAQLSPGDNAWMKDLQNRYKAISTGLEENPITTTLQNFSDKFKTPAPLDWSNPDAVKAGLMQRARIAQFAAQNWQRPAVSALDKADIAQVQAGLENPDPQAKAQIFGALSTLPEDVRNATLKKIGEKRPEFMIAAAAGSMMQSAPDIATSIFRGQSAIKADKGYLPTQPGENQNFTEKLDQALPASTFTLQARTDDNGPYEVTRGMIKARYADLAAQAGDTSGKLKSDRLTQSVQDVTGGVLYHNGGSLIAPRRGMAQSQFDLMLANITPNDLAGVTDASGEPITPQYLRDRAQFESVASGRYLMKLGRDPAKPIYAYTNANSEAPQKFVLDLRGRPVPPVFQDQIPFAGVQ